MTPPYYILFCEDDEGILEVVSIVLEGRGYEVKAMSQSELVYEEIRRRRPDLLLLDLWMPKLSGEQITATLKSHVDTKDIPIILISANKDTGTIAKKVGADNFLFKPFEIKDLEAIVGQYLPL